MKTAIGIDIGGTKISGVLGTDTGKILASFRIPTEVRKKSLSCVQTLVTEILSLKRLALQKKLKLAGAGICLPGAVDAESGLVPRSPNLPGWTGIPLRRLIEAKTKLSVRMLNDANAAAVAEGWLGQGKDVSDFIYMTVSTGIGAGIFVGGTLLEGGSFVAGEVGHMTVVPGGQLCRCGNHGCLEAYASGTSIARDYRNRVKNSRDIHGAKEVGVLVKQGDTRALDAYNQSAFYLGIGIANLLNILNPQKVILGGGVFRSSPSSYWKAILKSAKKHAWPEAFRGVSIVRTDLTGDTGNLGALAMGFGK